MKVLNETISIETQLMPSELWKRANTQLLNFNYCLCHREGKKKTKQFLALCIPAKDSNGIRYIGISPVVKEVGIHVLCKDFN